MRRRRFVGLGGACLAGLAGCLSFDPAGGRETSTGDGPTGTPATDTATGGTSPAVSAAATALQPGVVEMTSPDSIGVSLADGRRFLLVDLSVDDGEAPPREEFALRFDGGRYAPVGDDRRLRRDLDGDAGRYERSSGEGWVLFDLPETGDPADLAVAWAGRETPVEDGVAGSLTARLSNAPPPLALDLAVPETATPGEPTTVEFTVTNEGTHTGQFVAGLNRAGPLIAHAPVAPVRRPIPAGATETWTVADDGIRDPGSEGPHDGEPTATYHVDWTGGRRSREVRVALDDGAGADG